MSFDINTWGNIIWFLFHSLAHKIKDSDFNLLKNDLIYLVKTICANLPCQECSKDATKELSYIKFNNITTINEFKLFLFHFHNKINSKLNKPIFELSELDKKYSQANIKIIYKNFLIVFSSNSNIPQLMSQTFHRKYVLAQIKETLDRIMLKIN